MECFDRDGNFFVPRRVPVVEAYILREIENGKTREQIMAEMKAQDEADRAPF